MADTKLYVPVVTVSIQDNSVLLKSGFRQTITGISINQKCLDKLKVGTGNLWISKFSRTE